VYLLVDAISFFTKQVKKKQKREAQQGTTKSGTCTHITTMAAMRGIGSDVHINIQMKCVIYIPMTLLVMGEVPHQRLYVCKATTTTQRAPHSGAY